MSFDTCTYVCIFKTIIKVKRTNMFISQKSTLMPLGNSSLTLPWSLFVTVIVNH